MKHTLTVLLIFLGLSGFGYHCTHRTKAVAQISYVGSAACQSCHPRQSELFLQSDHYHAMDTANTSTVLGNFNDSRFYYPGDTAYFYTKNGGYFVRTTDSTGNKREFRIKYTFGWRPLQQYLVEFPDGKIQVLPFCWDTRAADKGGQRWFHLYDKERIAHTDELFWMGINQNWNYMCADCHTTDYRKNFDLASNRFNSRWKESRVSCESCHGPGSAHLKWAETPNKDVINAGFPVSLAAKKTEWRMDPVKRTMVPSQVLRNDTLLETCFRCHARATRFTDEYHHGRSLLQSHLPATADPVNYYVDGQIKEEDYEYGSFLQSKMYAAGVTCIHCHEPHSMKVRADGNALCTTCHTPAKYDGPQHSFHTTSGPGNQCRACHMPVTTYMVVDNRLDHSIRIPRPDLSLQSGAPNACNKCHKDKTVQWAADHFITWFGNKLPARKSYAELLYAISKYVKESEPSLYELLQGKEYPAIIRATAMEQYGYFKTTRVLNVVMDELKSPDPLIRLTALRALGNYDAETILGHAAPLLEDPVVAVRMEAMNLLAPLYSKMGDETERKFNIVKQAYLIQQEQLSHRPEGFFNRAMVLHHTGEAEKAEQIYRDCIRRFPEFVPSYSNLIDLYQEQGREQEARAINEEGLKRLPGNGYLRYTLALWYIRSRQNEKGLAELKVAAEADPSNAQFAYGYAIGLFSMGRRQEAITTLEQFVNRFGNQPLALDGLISMSSDMKLTEKVSRYEKLRREIYGY